MTRRPFAAVVMLGPEGTGPIESLVAAARQAAARDLVADLVKLPEIERILVATSEREWAAGSGLPVEWDFDDGSPFHFGARLADLVQRAGLERVAYFGAGSAPLLRREDLQRHFALLAESPGPAAVTNNLHSSDWMLFESAERLADLAPRLPNDNALGWVLQTEAGFRVQALPASAATRVDLDTPADFAPLRYHPDLKPHLRRCLEAIPLDTSRFESAARRLFTPASQVALIGRVSSAAWAYVERNTQVWIRVLSEERGMSASGRLAAGQVRSLVAEYIQRVGIPEFFDGLARLADAAFVDNRVILAHARSWPSAADRYASDFGRPDLIADEFLRALTEAALAARIPIVMGGHGVVAGGLYALVEAVQAGTLSVQR